MSSMVDSLRAVPLFADLNRRDVKQLAASMREVSFEAGREVVGEGNSAIGFFVILEGKARVHQGNQDRAVLTTGDYFGEMALIDGEERSASVHAETPLRCATMMSPTFRLFVKEHPDVTWALLTAMVKRVRSAQAQKVTLPG
jgi:CRP/FNR family transcriptional regulator, cyclic AMP receptor protein